MGKRLHGESGRSITPEYRAWRDMRARCNDEKHAAFPDYGGRGIVVCRRWADYEKFLEDMGRRPSTAHSLERKDNRFGYSPYNCVWATRSEQQNNTRKTTNITYEGKTQSVAQWAKELGLSATTIHSRIRRGWPLEEVLQPPKYHPGKPS